MSRRQETSPRYLSIQEVSSKLQVPKHTLRFWEMEFANFLVPLRTRGGQRRYTAQNISIIKRIKDLKERGMSLTGIHAYLVKKYASKTDTVNPTRIDFLADRVAEVVREEVYRFFDKEARERVRS